MQIIDLILLCASLLFVLGLMVAISWLFKKYGTKFAGLSRREGATFKIRDSLLLDPRRKLYLLQSGEKFYVVLTGPNGDVVVDNDARPDLDLDSVSPAPHDKKHA